MAKEQLNIWMFAKWYPNRTDPQNGVFVRKHAQLMAENFKVSVLSVFSGEDNSELFEAEVRELKGVHEVIIYFKKQKGFAGRIVNMWRYLQATRKGISMLKAYAPAPDFIHGYILLRSGLIAFREAWRYKVPYVISEQWSGFATGRYREQNFFRKWLTRYIVKNAGALVPVSRFLARKMEKNGLQNSRVVIIPNAVEDIPGLNKKGTDKKIRVLLVADLVDRIKNVSGVLKMISEIPPEYNFSLEIIGDGPDKRMLEKLAADLQIPSPRLFFEGRKINEQVYESLQRCDFLLMNSNFETFSLICAEALSCGKPVLATRCGGPDEFITETAGILIKPGDELELKKKFLWMLEHFENFDSAMIKNYAHENFSRKKIAGSFKTLYLSLSHNEQ